MNRLQRRILELSYRLGLSHIGSCIGAVDLIDAIYDVRKPDEPFIASCGHVGLALYVVLEKRLGHDAEVLFRQHGVHPNRDLAHGIECTSGSLGQAVTVAVGRALAKPDRRVWCLISDGELMEGATMEALRFAGHSGRVDNLRVFMAANGYGAYGPIPLQESDSLARGLCPDIRTQARHIETFGIPFLKGLSAHYHVMSEADWVWVQAQEVTP